MSKGIIVGIVLTFVAGIAGAFLFIALGCMPANADSKPSPVERWMARTSLRASLKREAPQTPNPAAFNDENLVAGIKLYATNCAVCHGASDGKPSNIAVGLFQHAPQLAKDDVTDDPEGKIFWFVKHGVRLTGMPAFNGALTDQQIWQTVLFLKHMNALTREAQEAWKAVPSAEPHS